MSFTTLMCFREKHNTRTTVDESQLAVLTNQDAYASLVPENRPSTQQTNYTTLTQEPTRQYITVCNNVGDNRDDVNAEPLYSNLLNWCRILLSKSDSYINVCSIASTSNTLIMCYVPVRVQFKSELIKTVLHNSWFQWFHYWMFCWECAIWHCGVCQLTCVKPSPSAV